MPGYSDPVGTKTDNGDLIFHHDVKVVRYGMLGHWSAPAKVLGRERLTNIVERSSLSPATNFWVLRIASANCPVAAEDPAAPVSSALPLRDYQVDSDGRWNYPARECVLWAGDWVWYVPPQRAGGVPKAAILSAESTKTPRGVYPLRVVLFPVVLVGDLVYWPVAFVASGGKFVM